MQTVPANPTEGAPVKTDAPQQPQQAANPATPINGGPAALPRSASLYVGDLDPNVTEANLFEVFNAVAPVSSIRVCRHAITRESLGYAYVNFHAASDAERVLDTMNYTPIAGRTCRIMWSQRDPSKRRSGRGNVFVKNLSPKIDSKDLHDTFSLFGNILSCKVAMDRNGNSKGYGFVHFETDQAAEEAIQGVNGMELEGRRVVVERYAAPTERRKADTWTNIYVKDFPLSWSEDDLRKMFEPFGKITSVFMPTEQDGSSKGFAFINYEDQKAAVAAVDALNGKPMKLEKKKQKSVEEDGETKVVEEKVQFEKPLYVGRAMTKAQRDRAVKAKIEQRRADRINRFVGLNLYVRNLDESVTEDELIEEFKQFGPVTSVRVARDKEGRSRLFGYVAFANQEDASAAVQRMNNKLFKGKPLFVTLWQPKEQRVAQLTTQHQARGPSGMAGAPMAFPMMQPGNMYFPRGMPMGMGMARGMPNAGFPGAAGGRGFPGYGMPMAMNMPGMMAGMQQQGFGGRGGGFSGRGGRGRGARFGRQQQGGAPGRQGQQPPMQYRNAVRNMPGMQEGVPQAMQMQQPMAQPAAAPAMSSEAAINPQELAAASPDVQKRMIGERLFMQIKPKQGELAGKITGMLLDGMDMSELLHLLESPEELEARIKEAIQVLEDYRKAGQ